MIRFRVRPRHVTLAALTALAFPLSGLQAQQAQQPPPSFQASVEVTPLAKPPVIVKAKVLSRPLADWLAISTAL